MSDIIDINVNQTVEQVEIFTTENLTTVNINTNTIVGEGDSKFTADIVVSLSNGKTAGKYTNGQTIPLIGKTPQQAFDDIFVETLFPNLINPLLGSLALNQALIQEVGSTLSNLILSGTFNRGTINPQYSAPSNFRSGLPNQHVFNGIASENTELHLNHIIASYLVLLGANNFTSQVNYDIGVQPKDSAGNDFNTPLAAGSSNVSSATIQGILPYFFGKSSIIPTANQSLINSGTKVVANSNGDISINFNANVEYLWFAIPATSASKTKWFLDAFNKGNIGSNSDLFGAFTTVNINSPSSLWSGQSYKIYISNYATTQALPYQLKNS